MPKRILIISHNAYFAGAPKLLVNLGNCLIEQSTNIDIEYMIKDNGPLLKEFKKIGKTVVLKKYSSNSVINLFFKLRMLFILKATNFNKYDIIISNTITNHDILPYIRKAYKGKIATYVHELKAVTEVSTNSISLKTMIKSSDIFLTPCKKVSKFIENKLKINPTDIHILPYYIPKKNGLNRKKKSSKKITVGGCGTLELRKGADLFVQVAKLFKERHPEIESEFIWKGGIPNSLEYKLINQDIRNLNLISNCVIKTSDDQMEDFYENIDLLLLTSREDPYPMVVLEAAQYQIPTICFENATGSTEFVQDNGKIVDYLNLNRMVDEIFFYHTNPMIKALDGLNSQIKMKKIHQDAESIFKKIETIISIKK